MNLKVINTEIILFYRYKSVCVADRFSKAVQYRGEMQFKHLLKKYLKTLNIAKRLRKIF